jgi:predicted DNA-binding antitoxin AbrB/MazE fold protein
MDYRVPAVYEEKGILRLLEPLDLPEHTKLTVTVKVSKTRERARTSRPRAQYPTRPQPLSSILAKAAIRSPQNRPPFGFEAFCR